uniref:Uncharacterized protein n=1 Tax=Brassica oleracea var. oleracea TaxID=109376 RepID=A0A0D3AGY0_BRAOL
MWLMLPNQPSSFQILMLSDLVVLPSGRLFLHFCDSRYIKNDEANSYGSQ